MKKFIMTLLAIVSLQGASMHGAWAWTGVKAAGRGINAFVGSPQSLSIAGFTTGLGLMWTGHGLNYGLNAPGMQKFLGYDQPTTWYGKSWRYMQSVDENLGTVLRWCGYAAALAQMANAMTASHDDDQSQQPKPTKRRLTPEEMQRLQRSRA